MESPLAVFADTNALYPPSLRYLLIEFAQADVIRLHWSPEVFAELSRAILKERPDKDPIQLTAQLAELDGALPSASVAATPHERAAQHRRPRVRSSLSRVKHRP